MCFLPDLNYPVSTRGWAGGSGYVFDFFAGIVSSDYGPSGTFSSSGVSTAATYPPGQPGPYGQPHYGQPGGPAWSHHRCSPAYQGEPSFHAALSWRRLLPWLSARASIWSATQARDAALAADRRRRAGDRGRHPHQPAETPDLRLSASVGEVTECGGSAHRGCAVSTASWAPAADDGG